jgi:ABC-type transport system involved in cytochrome c biogenesis ATPase subunit
MPEIAQSCPAPTPLACVRDLHFSYGTRAVFAGLHFEIHAGLTWVLGGEGCGKSTLLRLLAGAITRQKSPVDWMPLDAAQAGAPAPHPSVYWTDPREEQHDRISARAYFAAMQARHTDFSPQDLNALVQDLGLAEQLDKPLYMLSTGSKRKVWLAGAFASRCHLTLLDEPFAALDQRSVNCVKAWLNRVAQDGTCAWVVADYEAPQGVAVGHHLALDALTVPV